MTNFASQVVESEGTNAIVVTMQVSDEINPVPLMHHLKVPGLALVAIATVLVARHWLKKSAAAFEKNAHSQLLEDIVDALAPKEADRNSLREELSAMISYGTQPSTLVLASILRIEESFEKRHDNKYLQRVSILRRKDDTDGSLVKIEREISWEYLPGAVRGEFIRTRGDKVARRIFAAEREKK